MRKLIWLLLAVFFCVEACTKIESTNIGGGLIPPVDGVITLDTTLTVYSNNFYDGNRDTVRVYKGDEHVIGVINNDPLFGTTTATAYMELKPTNYKYSFPGLDTKHADSAVLVLSYRGAYGDTDINQRWEVKELSETIKNDSIF